MTIVSQPKFNFSVQKSKRLEGVQRSVVPVIVPPDPPSTFSALTKGLNSGETNAFFTSVATDGNGNWVAVAINGWAARSTDNGLTWSALPQGLNSGLSTASFQTVSADSSGVFIAAATSGWAARSTDGGATWSSLTRGLAMSTGVSTDISIIANDGFGNWVVGSTDDETSYSTDGGATFQAGANFPSGTDVEGIAYLGTPGAFIGVGDNGIAGTTSDSGATWSSFLTPQGLNSNGGVNTNFNSVAVAGSNVLVQARGLEGVISEDLGSNWAAAPDAFDSGNPGVQVFGFINSDGTNVVSVQENGYAAVSADRGLTWSALTQGLNSGSIGADWNGVATDGNGVWVAVADFGYASRGTP